MRPRCGSPGRPVAVEQAQRGLGIGAQRRALGELAVGGRAVGSQQMDAQRLQPCAFALLEPAQAAGAGAERLAHRRLAAAVASRREQ
jgi:hypothetical protein